MFTFCQLAAAQLSKYPSRRHPLSLLAESFRKGSGGERGDWCHSAAGSGLDLCITRSALWHSSLEQPLPIVSHYLAAVGNVLSTELLEVPLQKNADVLVDLPCSRTDCGTLF